MAGPITRAGGGLRRRCGACKTLHATGAAEPARSVVVAKHTVPSTGTGGVCVA